MSAPTGRPSKLTDDLEQRLCSYIRAGAYPWVAAEAAGIANRTFCRWLSRGEAARTGRHYRFWRMVRQAAAEARVSAEIRVHQSDPAAWLTKGPGRTTPGEPGWTEAYDINLHNTGPLEVRVVYVDKATIADRQLRQIVDGGPPGPRP